MSEIPFRSTPKTRKNKENMQDWKDNLAKCSMILAVLVVVLTFFDLAFTKIEVATGQVMEGNPLFVALMDSPTVIPLVLFFLVFVASVIFLYEMSYRLIWIVPVMGLMLVERIVIIVVHMDILMKIGITY